MNIIEAKLKDSIIEFIKKIEIKKDDVLCLQVDIPIGQKEFENISETLRRVLPENRIIIFQKNFKLKSGLSLVLIKQMLNGTGYEIVKKGI